jgi:hypothetical protein
MIKPDLDIPGALIENFTARAAVLSDMYRQLSDPGIASSVITALATDDAKAHQRFLDGLKPDRWPLGRLDLCIRILDYVKREIAGPPRDVAVWVIRRNLTLFELLQVARILQQCAGPDDDPPTRTAAVAKGRFGVDPMGVQTIVDAGPCQDALRNANFLEDAFEAQRDVFEVNWPTGGAITLCLPR